MDHHQWNQCFIEWNLITEHNIIEGNIKQWNHLICFNVIEWNIISEVNSMLYWRETHHCVSLSIVIIQLTSMLLNKAKSPVSRSFSWIQCFYWMKHQWAQCCKELTNWIQCYYWMEYQWAQCCMESSDWIQCYCWIKHLQCKCCMESSNWIQCHYWINHQ